MLTWRIWCCGLIVAACAASQAEAQRTGTSSSMNTGTYPPQSSMTGSSGGMFGTSGSSLTGSSTSASASGFGMGGTQSGFGMGTQTGMGTGQTGRNNTGMGNTQGANSFLGANNNPNSFLGRNNQGQQSGQNNQFGQGGRGGGQRGMDQSLQNLLNGGGQYGQSNANQKTTVRPQQKIAFDHPTLKTPAVVEKIETRIAKLSTRYPKLKSVEVAAGEDGVVVLRGTVDSESSAKVAESFVRLEPGVKAVQNELTFPPPSAGE
jgi:osmotically-inducible protein OsmY